MIPENFSQLLAEAKKIIPAAKKQDLQKHLRGGFRYVDRQRNFKVSGRAGVFTRKQKAAAKNFEVALHQLQMALEGMKAVNLHRSVAGNFPMDRKYFEIWRKRAKEAAGVKLRKDGRAKPEDREAVRQAAKLLQYYKIELSHKRNGPFCRMAAVFSGNPRANLYHKICEYPIKPKS